MNIDNNGNIVFSNTALGQVPVLIGNAQFLLPGYEKLYYQNPGFKYPYGWAKGIPWVNVVKWPTGKIELYSDIAVNDPRWNDRILNFDKYVKRTSFSMRIYPNPKSNIVSFTQTFLDWRMLEEIILKLFSVHGELQINASNLEICTASKESKFFFDYPIHSGNLFQSIYQNLGGYGFRLPFNAIRYLNALNQKPGIGNCNFHYFAATQLKALSYTQGKVITPATWSQGLFPSCSCDIFNMTKSFSNAGIDGTTFENFPADRKFDVQGIIAAAAPPAPAPPAPAPPAPAPPAPAPPAPAVPTAAAPPAPAPAPVKPSPMENLPTFPKTSQAPPEEIEPPPDLAKPSSEKFNTSIDGTGVGDRPVTDVPVQDGTVPKTSETTFGEWVDSRVIDPERTIPKTSIETVGTPLSKADPVQPLEDLVPLPLPPDFQPVIIDGDLTGAIYETFYFPITHPRFGEHHRKDRNARIIEENITYIGSPDWGKHFEELPAVWWIK